MVAQALVANGADVWITGHREDAPKTVAKKYSGKGAKHPGNIIPGTIIRDSRYLNCTKFQLILHRRSPSRHSRTRSPGVNRTAFISLSTMPGCLMTSLTSTTTKAISRMRSLCPSSFGSRPTSYNGSLHSKPRSSSHPLLSSHYLQMPPGPPPVKLPVSSMFRVLQASSKRVEGGLLMGRRRPALSHLTKTLAQAFGKFASTRLLRDCSIRDDG